MCILTKSDLCRYEVNFQDGIDCGGAYIKLLSDSEDLDLVCSLTASYVWKKIRVCSHLHVWFDLKQTLV